MTAFNKKGETIMEAVVSLLILGMLMTTVLTMIRFSLALTGDSLTNARENQEEINNLIHDIYPNSSNTNVTFYSVISASDVPDGVISSAHVIVINIPDAGNQNVVAFKPLS